MRVSVAGGLQQRLAYQAQCLAIAKEVGDRVGEGRACGNLGTCHMHLNEYFKAVAYFEAHHALATSMKLAHGQSQATLNMGVVFKLHLTHLTFDAGQEDAALDDEAVSRLIVLAKGHLPHDPDGKLLRMGKTTTCKIVTAMALENSSPLKKELFMQAMCIRLQEKQGWLAVRTDKFPAGDLEGAAKASLAIACYYCQLEELEKGRKWLEKGRKWMLTCRGCRVARFCSADHQKMASKKAALGGSLTMGRHKDICGVLRKWREVVKDGVSPDLCTADLVAFLQR